MNNQILECSKILLAIMAIATLAVLVFYPMGKKREPFCNNPSAKQLDTPQIDDTQDTQSELKQVVPPEIDQQGAFDNDIPYDYYFLDDGTGGKMGIQHNLCSKSCCSEQYPPPFKLKKDQYVCNNREQFVPSNIMCNNTFQDSGCLCLTNKQAQFLYNRGNAGRGFR